jgi:acetyltransferase-like isoleucine patch superfamily enzyme
MGNPINMSLISKILYKLYKLLNKEEKQIVTQVFKNSYDYYISKGVKLGVNVRIFGNIDKVNPHLISIGNHCVIGTSSAILTHGPTSGNKSVEIGSYVWVGYNALILPGVKIGDFTIIGAGSVVTKSFPNECVIAGNPAKILRKLTFEEKSLLINNLENRIPMGKVEKND